MLGATLLEIMLVLAVAALILLMSVKYYQTASASKQANDGLSMIQAIQSMADNVAAASGSYVSGGLNSTNVQAMLPNSGIVPWSNASSDVVTVGTVDATSYVINLPAVPANVCPLITSKLVGDSHYSNVTPCSVAAGTVSYTYTHTGGY